MSLLEVHQQSILYQYLNQQCPITAGWEESWWLIIKRKITGIVLVPGLANHAFTKLQQKWHLFQIMPQIFKRVKSSEEVFNSVHTCNDDASCQDVSYPPNSPTVKRMMKYMLENKKIPVEIPQTILQKSKHGKAFNTFPKTSCA